MKKKENQVPERTDDAVELTVGEESSGYSLQQLADALGEEMLKKRKAETPVSEEEKATAEPTDSSSEATSAPGPEPAPAPEATPSSDEETQRKIAELEETIKRLVAENRNQKIRLENDLRTKVKFANELFFREFILIKDDLEKALSFAPENGDERTAAFVQGIRHLDAAITALLKRHSVESYDALGQSFDPALHEAMRVVDVAGVAANIVTTQYCKGYRFFERVLRPAMVEIASGRPPAEQDKETKEEAAPASKETANKETNNETDHTEDSHG